MSLFQERAASLGTGNECCALLDGALTVLTLGERLGSDGAEGRVFMALTPTQKRYAVKIYYDDYLQQRREPLFKKLQYMTLAQEQFVQSEEPLFAWPLQTVHLGTNSSNLGPDKFVGFVMRLLPELTDFYSLVKRSSRHNLPTRTQLIAISYYLAKGFKMLHDGVSTKTDAGQTRLRFVVGDVNDSNIRVAIETNVVCFFDCDSYIVRTSAESLEQWTSTEIYSSPEFLNPTKTRRRARTARDDNYGLAVLIFRILNNWWLPYLYDGGGGNNKASLILEGRFPFGRGSLDRVVPGAEEALSAYQSEFRDEVKTLFERAFVKGLKRPSAKEWVEGLQIFLLSRSDLRSQPKPKPRPTPKPKVQRTTTAQAVPSPQPLVSPSQPTIAPSVSRQPTGQSGWGVVAAIVLWAVVLYFLLFFR